jgi:hypothetical protein
MLNCKGEAFIENYSYAHEFPRSSETQLHCPIENTCTRTLIWASVHTLTPCFSEFGINMIFTIPSNDPDIAQAMSRRLPTAATRVRSHVKSCKMWHWGRFPPSTSVFFANSHSTKCSILVYHPWMV